MDSKFSSLLLDNAVNEFAKLPGIGKKTALRLVLFQLKQKKEETFRFTESINQLKENIKHCKNCNNLSDNEICEVCSDPSRDSTTVCIVENIKDVIAIENTQQYCGIYHVLGGVISPMDGVGPNDLEIPLLEKKVQNNEVKEIIFALSSTMEGDTTNFYIYRRFQKYSLKFSLLARGIAIGDELEYIDELTLGRSIVERTEFKA